MKTVKTLALFAVALALFISCDDEDETQQSGNISLNITGLTDLGSDYVYEGWIIVDGEAITTGIFDVDENGDLSETDFTIESELLEQAATFVLTIEPQPDADPAPSSVHILAGDIASNKATLEVGHSAALGNDFSDSEGVYILATPTNDIDTDETSGVWFIDNSSGEGVAGLALPVLPDGWEYEGWAVIDGQPVTTGKFTDIDMADAASTYSGSLDSPPFPGEDFIENAPDGLTFPADLLEAAIVISIEPVPDNSSDPFLLKPLFGEVPADAEDHKVYSLDNISADTNPSGSLSIN